MSDNQIIDYFGIPSSESLLLMGAVPIEDLRLFKEKADSIKAVYWGTDDG